jgi:hypothetical protein
MSPRSSRSAVVGVVVLVVPADADAELVEPVERAAAEADEVGLAQFGVPVVGGAQEASVELAGGPSAPRGDDVVDIAPGDRRVASGAVPAATITHLDSPAHSTVERTPAGHRHHRGRPVEQH